MDRFVYWTGIYNVVMGLGFCIPGFPTLLGVNLPSSPLWLWLPALLIVYLGIMLVICLIS